jgi:hypothetical protein
MPPPPLPPLPPLPPPPLPPPPLPAASMMEWVFMAPPQWASGRLIRGTFFPGSPDHNIKKKS